jgi:GAF domain-containing protein
MDAQKTYVLRLNRNTEEQAFSGRGARAGTLADVASHGLSPEVKEFFLNHPFSADRGTITGRVELERRVVHIPDVLQDPEFTYWERQKVAGFRTMLGIPLLREQALIGILNVLRTRVDPFTHKDPRRSLRSRC